ncbi:MAG: pyridoxamine 5'-phosphate oxidase family protein [Gammaproteobacteria bacterium]|nr:pyridoxamine 5'-phosphate oxidase family protein [Gammaproteobacteria bacterium]
MSRDDTGQEERQEEFLSVLARFDHAMLVTRDPSGGLRSRPMAIADSSEDGRLWFMSNVHSGKQEELAEDDRVNVAMQGGGRFLSITGKARVVRDEGKQEELWNEAQRVWFPDGPHDASLVLIEVVPDDAEYWDGSGLKGLKYLFNEARAIVGGGSLDDDARVHGKVDLD